MSQQIWNASEYKKYASFVPSAANAVVELLNPQQGEVILDIGCGDGQLSAVIQERGCTVIGIDSSPSMVESAKSRGIAAHVMDGHKITYQNQFDAVFSNAALHWLTQPENVVRSAYAALKNNGRFVAEFGGYGNIAALIKAMREVFEDNPQFGEFQSPWFFPTVAEYRRLLEDAGFQVKSIALIPRPTPLKDGVGKWLEIFAYGITSHLNPEQKAQFFQSVETQLLPVLYTEHTGWVADYVRLRFEAIKT